MGNQIQNSAPKLDDERKLESIKNLQNTMERDLQSRADFIYAVGAVEDILGYDYREEFLMNSETNENTSH